MNRITYRLAVLAACLWAGAVAANDTLTDPGRSGAPADEGLAQVADSGGRWAARLVRRHGASGVVIVDRQEDRSYRLSDLENIGIQGLHWIGPDSLELDFTDHATVLRVRTGAGGASPTFHLVSTEFNVQGAPRVDYFSPPLAVLHTDAVPRLDGRNPVTPN